MAAVHDYLGTGLLLAVTLMQALLAIDRWVHKQSSDDSTIRSDMRELKMRVTDDVRDLNARMNAIEHDVEQIIQRASEINSTLQRMVGRLEIGRFRGDGQG